MAYEVRHVRSSRLHYGQGEVARFEAARRYLRAAAGPPKPRDELLAGLPLPPELAPRRATLRWVKPRHRQSHVAAWSAATGKDPYEYDNPLGDVVGSHFGWIVSTRVKDLIETLEPNGQRFFAFTFHRKDGAAIGRSFWLLNICVRLDAIAREVSDVLKVGPDLENDPGNWWYVRRRYWKDAGRLDTAYVGSAQATDGEIAVRKAEVAGHAIWWDRRWRTVFISDALHGRIRAARIDDLWSEYVPEVEGPL